MSSTTPNMSLVIPTVGNSSPPDGGPGYATEINAAIVLIDAHDHSSGKGLPVTQNGLNITGDLTFGSNAALNLSRAGFISQAAALTNIRSIYSVLGELYYTDGSGNQVKITASGAVNTGGTGNLSGMDGSAAVTYSAITKTFTFTQSSGFPAKVAHGDLQLFETVAAAAQTITIKAPAGLANTFSLTLPGALPATTVLPTFTSAGVMAFLAAPAGTSLLQSTSAGVVSYVTTLPSGLTLPSGTTLTSPALSGTPTGSWTSPVLTTPLINSHSVALTLPLSTVQDFTAPPAVVPSASISNNAGINFNLTAHGMRSGEAVQLTTSNTLPGGLALTTTYYVIFVDANNFKLSATGTYVAKSDGTCQFTSGSAIAYVNAGVGNQTVTPGFLPQTNQIAADIDLVGAGGGGGGSSSNIQTAGNGGTGGDSTIGTLAWTAKGGPGGTGAASQALQPGGIAPAATSSTVTSGRIFKGRDGTYSSQANATGTIGGTGFQTTFSPYGDGGQGAYVLDSGAANGYGGGGGASGARCNGRPTVTAGTWYSVVIGAAGTAGSAGNVGQPGIIGGGGFAQVRL